MRTGLRDDTMLPKMVWLWLDRKFNQISAHFGNCCCALKRTMSKTKGALVQYRAESLQQRFKIASRKPIFMVSYVTWIRFQRTNNGKILRSLMVINQALCVSPPKNTFLCFVARVSSGWSLPRVQCLFGWGIVSFPRTHCQVGDRTGSQQLFHPQPTERSPYKLSAQ